MEANFSSLASDLGAPTGEQHQKQLNCSSVYLLIQAESGNHFTHQASHDLAGICLPSTQFYTVEYQLKMLDLSVISPVSLVTLHHKTGVEEKKQNQKTGSAGSPRKL